MKDCPVRFSRQAFVAVLYKAPFVIIQQYKLVLLLFQGDVKMRNELISKHWSVSKHRWDISPNRADEMAFSYSYSLEFKTITKHNAVCTLDIACLDRRLLKLLGYVSEFHLKKMHIKYWRYSWVILQLFHKCRHCSSLLN